MARTKSTLITEISGRGVATLTLRRAELHNAFDDELIERLRRELQGLENDPVVRVIVIKGDGPNFCAGADLNWMKRMAEFDRAANIEDAKGFAKMMAVLHRVRQPTVAVVQGAAFGGGVGLVAACDIVVAASDATFCLSEVRLGLIPAVIGPYLVNAIGERQSLRYMMTAEKFGADEALSTGLVQVVVPPEQLEQRADALVSDLLKGGPKALAEVKNLISYISSSPSHDEKVVRDTAGHIARVRATEEGIEGVSAFLEKRSPKWVRD